MCSYYYNPKLHPPPPSTHTFSFHHFPQENFSWAVEEAVLLKEGQWLSEVGGEGFWGWGARVAMSDALSKAALFGWLLQLSQRSRGLREIGL